MLNNASELVAFDSALEASLRGVLLVAFRAFRNEVAYALLQVPQDLEDPLASEAAQVDLLQVVVDQVLREAVASSS